MRPLWRTLCALGVQATCMLSVWASDTPYPADVEKALKSNNAQEIEQVLQSLSQSSQSGFGASFYRGLIYLKREQFEPAIASFSVIPASSPYYLDARNNLAIIYAAQGKFNLAKSTLEDALKANKSMEVMYKNLNDLKSHLAYKNYASALQLLDSGKNGKPALVVLTGLPSTPAAKTAEASPVLAQAATASSPPAKSSEAPSSTKPTASATTAPPPPAAPPSTPAVSATEAKTTALKAAPKADAPAGHGSAETDATKAAVQAVHEWVRAWEKKDIDRYLAAYAPDFVPAEGKSRNQWVKDRQAKILSKGRIKIQMGQTEATLVSPTQIKVRFQQNYQSDQFKSVSDKTLELKWSGSHWLITRERASESARK